MSSFFAYFLKVFANFLTNSDFDFSLLFFGVNYGKIRSDFYVAGKEIHHVDRSSCPFIGHQ